MSKKKTKKTLKESNYSIVTERLHNLEKNMDFVIDWLDEISPLVIDIPKEKKKYGVKELPDPPPFFYFGKP